MPTLQVPGTPGTPIYAGRPTPAGGSLLTTLTLVNTSGSEQAANFVAPMFGQPFVQGDVPSGQYPAFELTDGTPCPASLGPATYWPDGSMRFVPVLMRVPASIAGSGSLTVNVKNGGSAPVASSVTASTLTASSDLKVSLNALRNWTAGEWVSAVNQGITDGDVWTFADGPAGRVLRVYEGFRQSGADHGQAGVWHYIQVLQNSSGGLYGLRHLGKFANGWHDVTSPQINVLVADACALKNGTTTIRNIAPSAGARTFSWSSGFTAANVTGLVSGMPVRLTTTGTLPAGLSSTTAYFVRLTGGNGFTLHPSINDVEFNANAVTASDAGSGTHTLTPVFHMEAYAAGPYTVGSDTQFDFIQAGGTGAECSVSVQQDKEYAITTRIFGSVRTDVTPTILDDRSYAIDTYQDVTIGQDLTGERPDIGYMSGWCTRHLMRGERFKTIRTYALQQAAKSWSIRRLSTKAPINLTNDAYTGLGTAMPDYRYRPSNPAANSGVNAPADYFKVRGMQDWAHQPHFLGYAYSISGEPQFLDALLDMATAGIANTTNKTATVSSVTYHSILLRDADGQSRVEAWIMREVAWSALLCPPSFMGADIGQQFRDILARNFDYLKAEKLTGTTFTRDNKFYPVFGGSGRFAAPWQLAYLMTAFNQAYTATGDVDAKTAIEDIIDNYDRQRQNLGLFGVSSYYMEYVGGAKGMTAWGDVLCRQAVGNLAFDASTDVFTSSGRAAGHGDLANDAPLVNKGFPPGGMTQNTRYYLRDVSGSTFKIAATVGGAAINITTTDSVGSDYWAAQLPNASNSTMNEGVNQKSYPVIIIGAMRWAKALGCTVPPAFETAVNAVYGSGPTFTDDPVYALAESF